MNKYGICVAREIDIAKERWIENLESLAKSILATVNTSKEVGYRKEYRVKVEDAKVITDPLKTTLNKGEILGAPFTDLGWTPLFINAAGLVMEVADN